MWDFPEKRNCSNFYEKLDGSRKRNTINNLRCICYPKLQARHFFEEKHTSTRSHPSKGAHKRYLLMARLAEWKFVCSCVLLRFFYLSGFYFVLFQPASAVLGWSSQCWFIAYNEGRKIRRDFKTLGRWWIFFRNKTEKFPSHLISHCSPHQVFTFSMRAS